MQIERYTLFLHAFEIEAEIGIHAFERGRRQRVRIAIELDIAPSALPVSDDIGGAFDYDWVRLAVLDLARRQRFDLQETLARAILDIVATRPEVVRAVVETAKPDVYPDAAAVGCRLVAGR